MCAHNFAAGQVGTRAACQASPFLPPFLPCDHVLNISDEPERIDPGDSIEFLSLRKLASHAYLDADSPWCIHGATASLCVDVQKYFAVLGRGDIRTYVTHS